MELENMSLSLKADYWWKRHLAENSSFITDTFCGQLVSTIQCSVCKTNSYCFDPFYDISLPFSEGNNQLGGHQHNRRKGSRPSIKPSWLSMNNNNNTGDAKSCTLDDCLREFTKDEVLDGENKIECSSCRVKRTMVKRLQVFRFPQVLVLHLKRFGNSRKKIRTAVQFPITGFDASPLAYQNDTRPEYDLFAVVDHSGRMNFGHYTASCIDPQSDEWQQFNDEEVDGIDASDLNEANAYMLFYKIRES